MLHSPFFIVRQGFVIINDDIQDIQVSLPGILQPTRVQFLRDLLDLGLPILSFPELRVEHVLEGSIEQENVQGVLQDTHDYLKVANNVVEDVDPIYLKLLIISVSEQQLLSNPHKGLFNEPSHVNRMELIVSSFLTLCLDLLSYPIDLTLHYPSGLRNQLFLVFCFKESIELYSPSHPLVR